MVAADTRKRVLAAISETGFVRNDAARQLRGGQAQAIGLVTLDIDNPFFTEVARGVEAAVGEADLMLFLCSSAGSIERENSSSDCSRAARRRHPDVARRAQPVEERPRHP